MKIPASLQMFTPCILLYGHRFSYIYVYIYICYWQSLAMIVSSVYSTEQHLSIQLAMCIIIYNTMDI